MTSTAPRAGDVDRRHRHVRSCYWDHRRAGWVCPGPSLELVAVTPATWEECARLTVHEHQRAFVADVAWYLRDSADGGVWHPVAAVLEDRVVGFAVWAVDDDGSGWIGGVVVDAAAQGRGIGRRLVQLLMAQLLEAGAPSLGLTYAPANTVARDLYASLGFVESGERDGDEVVARWTPADPPAAADQPR
jgi:diamine N-acetyltransferase